MFPGPCVTRGVGGEVNEGNSQWVYVGMKQCERYVHR